MPQASAEYLTYEVVELGGTRYAILPEVLLRQVCRRAKVQAVAPRERQAGPDGLLQAEQFDARVLADRLVARRKQAGLSQAQLARRAGVRAETLNRIERNKVTPDYATIRKLVTAIKAAEAEARG